MESERSASRSTVNFPLLVNSFVGSNPMFQSHRKEIGKNFYIQWSGLGERGNISGYCKSGEVFCFLGNIPMLDNLFEGGDGKEHSSAVVSFNGENCNNNTMPRSSYFSPAQIENCLYEEMTVMEVIRFSEALRSTHRTYHNVSNAIESMNLQGLARTQVKHLTNYQKWKVLVAAECAADRLVLFLEDPTSSSSTSPGIGGLHPEELSDMFTSLRACARQGRIVVTHFQAFSARHFTLTDRCQILVDGGENVPFSNPNRPRIRKVKKKGVGAGAQAQQISSSSSSTLNSIWQMVFGDGFDVAEPSAIGSIFFGFSSDVPEFFATELGYHRGSNTDLTYSDYLYAMSAQAREGGGGKAFKSWPSTTSNAAVGDAEIFSPVGGGDYQPAQISNHQQQHEKPKNGHCCPIVDKLSRLIAATTMTEDQLNNARRGFSTGKKRATVTISAGDGGGAGAVEMGTGVTAAKSVVEDGDMDMDGNMDEERKTGENELGRYTYQIGTPITPNISSASAMEAGESGDRRLFYSAEYERRHFDFGATVGGVDAADGGAGAGAGLGKISGGFGLHEDTMRAGNAAGAGAGAGGRLSSTGHIIEDGTRKGTPGTLTGSPDTPQTDTSGVVPVEDPELSDDGRNISRNSITTFPDYPDMVIEKLPLPEFWRTELRRASWTLWRAAIVRIRDMTLLGTIVIYSTLIPAGGLAFTFYKLPTNEAGFQAMCGFLTVAPFGLILLTNMWFFNDIKDRAVFIYERVQRFHHALYFPPANLALDVLLCRLIPMVISCALMYDLVKLSDRDESKEGFFCTMMILAVVLSLMSRVLAVVMINVHQDHPQTMAAISTASIYCLTVMYCGFLMRLDLLVDWKWVFRDFSPFYWGCNNLYFYENEDKNYYVTSVDAETEVTFSEDVVNSNVICNVIPDWCEYCLNGTYSRRFLQPNYTCEYTQTIDICADTSSLYDSDFCNNNGHKEVEVSGVSLLNALSISQIGYEKCFKVLFKQLGVYTALALVAMWLLNCRWNPRDQKKWLWGWWWPKDKTEE